MPPFDLKTYEIPLPPKEGRIEKYLERFQKFDTPDQLITFMGTVFTDTLEYLGKEQKFTFPEIRLTYYYRQEEWDDLISRLDGIGKKPHRRAMVVRTSEGVDVYINVMDHWSDTSIDFLINLCSSFIEELVHVIYPMRSETQIQDIVCTMLEGFIEVKLPDEVKEARLLNSKKYDESK